MQVFFANFRAPCRYYLYIWISRARKSGSMVASFQASLPHAITRCATGGYVHTAVSRIGATLSGRLSQRSVQMTRYRAGELNVTVTHRDASEDGRGFIGLLDALRSAVEKSPPQARSWLRTRRQRFTNAIAHELLGGISRWSSQSLGVVWSLGFRRTWG